MNDIADEAVKNTGEVKTSGYEAKIAEQQALVDELTEEYTKDPSPALQLRLDRRKDTLLHLKNLAKGDPGQRAKGAAETAKISTLTKAITQPLRPS